MTALSIVQRAASRIGITAPTALFASTNDQLIQIRNLMNQEGIELARGAGTDYAWKALTKEKTFTTTAAAAQTGALPSDFGWYINETLWNRTTMVPGQGPIDGKTWQTWQAQAAIALPNFGFRFRGTDLLIYPSPIASQTMAYEYVTTEWALTNASVGLAAMTADDDTSKLDENLIVLGVIWRFLQAKGLDYGEAYRTYQIEVGKAISREGGRAILQLSGAPMPRYRGNIPEGSWAL